MKQNGGVFFDCWDTVIRFCMKTEEWNIAPLRKHTLNRDEIDWVKVQEYSETFFHQYFTSMSKYEITVCQYLTLLIDNFGMKINVSLRDIGDEILDYLDPTPLEGIQDFLSVLNEKGITHAVLSNTIYTTEATLKILNRLLPDAGFSFFFGSAEVGVKKPNPLFYQTGVKLAKKDIHECIYIGDAFVQDVYGPLQAGFKKAIWLNHKNKDLNRFRSLEGFDQLCFEEARNYQDVIRILKEEF